jgi:hypothetical protein
VSYTQFKLSKNLEEAFDNKTVMSGKYYNDIKAIQSWIRKQHSLMDYEELVYELMERYGLTEDEAEFAIADTLGLGEASFIKVKPSQFKEAEMALLKHCIPHTKLDGNEFKFKKEWQHDKAIDAFIREGIHIRG